MIFTQTESTLVGLACLLIGAWLAHHFTNWRNKKERFLNAYDALYAVFAPAIRELNNTDKIHVEVILAQYPIHEEAMCVFRRHLEGARLDRFNTKLTEYKEAYDHYKKYQSFMNSFKTMEDDEELFYKKKMLNLINEILEIAKQHK